MLAYCPFNSSGGKANEKLSEESMGLAGKPSMPLADRYASQGKEDMNIAD